MQALQVRERLVTHSWLYLMSLSTAMTPSILSCILQRSGSLYTFLAPKEGQLRHQGPRDDAGGLQDGR